MNTVYLHKRFDKEVYSLPKDIQRQVWVAVNDLRLGIMDKGINLELIQGAKSANVYSIRIAKGPRVLLSRLDDGAYVVYHFEHDHDKAYKWAERNRIVIDRSNIRTMFVEIGIDDKVVSASRSPKPIAEKKEKPILNPPQVANNLCGGWFAKIGTDEQIVGLGIPPILLPSLRAVNTEEGLCELHQVLQKSFHAPEELLFELDEIRRNPASLGTILLERRNGDKVKRESEDVIVVTDEVLAARMKPFVEFKSFILDEHQRAVVAMVANGPVMVTGGAGTGKTVVAVHRTKWLLEHIFTKPTDKVLVVTYSNTLVADLEQMIRKICRVDDVDRVSFMTIDELASQIVRDVLHKKIAYGHAETVAVDGLLDRALAETNYHGKRSRDFLTREFMEIVLGYNIDSADRYYDIVRAGMSGNVLHKERELLWPMFESMLKGANEGKVLLRPQALHVAAVAYEYLRTEKAKALWNAVVIDEAQDAGYPELRMFASITGNKSGVAVPYSLFIVGDGHQRIYARSGSLKDAGIDVHSRSRMLKINYRSTRLIRERAFDVIKDVPVKDMDGEAQSLVDESCLIEGERPIEDYRTGYDSMNQLIADIVCRWQQTDSGGQNRLGDYAVLLRRKGKGRWEHDTSYLFKTAEALTMHGLKAEMVMEHRSPKDRDAIKVMTMHRAKGLQFAGVVIVTDGWPLIPADMDEDEALSQMNREKCLMYTSMMRAQSHLLLTGTHGRAPDGLGIGHVVSMSKQSESIPQAFGVREQLPVGAALEHAIGPQDVVDRSSPQDLGVVEKILDVIKMRFTGGIHIDDPNDRKELGNEIGFVITDLMASQVKLRLFLKGNRIWYHPDSIMPARGRSKFLSLFDRGRGNRDEVAWLDELRTGMLSFMSKDDLRSFAAFIKNGLRNVGGDGLDHICNEQALPVVRECDPVDQSVMILCPTCRKLYQVGQQHICKRKKDRHNRGVKHVKSKGWYTPSSKLEELRDELYPE